jgi:hypothetical protein
MSFFPDAVDGCEILHQLKTVVSPTIYGGSTIQGGAGFLPSTVGTQSCCFFFLDSVKRVRMLSGFDSLEQDMVWQFGQDDWLWPSGS